MKPPVAVIDLGTHTALLLVARAAADGGLEVVEERCLTPRLGEGLARGGRLSQVACARALDALEEFSHVLGEADVPPARVRVVATAAVRQASNRESFQVACRDRIGAPLRVLSGEDEARSSFRGAVGSGSASTVVVDVGGGSTEVVTDGGERCRSVSIGALSLTERFLGLAGAAPLEPGGFEALELAVAGACSAFEAGAAAGRECVLIGGTAVNLACLEAGLDAFDHLRVEGLVLDCGAARRWAAQLIALPARERRGLPVESERAEILPAGLACAAACLERSGARQARVSSLGLRHGVALELLDEVPDRDRGRD